MNYKMTWLRKFCFMAVITAVLLTCFANFVLAKEIIIATGEWAPLTSESFDRNGMCAELTTAAFKEMGISVKYKFYPWKRVWLYMEKGKVDGAIPWMYTPEREDRVFFSDNIFFGKRGLFYHVEKLPEADRNAANLIKKYEISVIGADGHIAQLKRMGVKVNTVPSIKNGLKMLSRGHIKALFINYYVGWHEVGLLDENEKVLIRAVEYNISDRSNHIIFPKKRKGSADLCAKFNEGLKRIKANGIYDKIINDYRCVAASGGGESECITR